MRTFGPPAAPLGAPSSNEPAHRAANDRLRRGEDIGYVEAAQNGFDPDRLTIGFARRLATYKRLYLLSLQPDRGAATPRGRPAGPVRLRGEGTSPG